MSDLLQNWLNNDVGLSVNITNFEKDFANGYLFGEILHKFRQQDDFHQFENKSSHEAKMANYQRLEPTFKALGIKFNAQQGNAMMGGERGASLRILYQLKMTADRLSLASDASERSRETGAPVGSGVTKGIRIAREKFDSHERRFFEHRLRSTCLNVKQSKEASMLKKYEAEKEKQELLSLEMDRIDQARIAEQRDIHRFGMLERMRQNRLAKDEWDRISTDLWSQNMKARKDREKREVAFEGRVIMKQSMKTQAHLASSAAEVNNGIDVFESGLEGLGLRNSAVKPTSLSESSDGEDSDNTGERLLKGTTQVANQRELVEALETRLPNSQELEQEANLFLQKIKESKHAGSIARKERERRRRRVLVDQQREQELMQERTMEDALIKKINRESIEEKKISYTVWRTQQYEEVIVQNRQLRMQEYSTQRKEDLKEALRRDEDLLKEMLETICEQQEREQMRYRAVERGRLAQHTHRIAQESEGILQLLSKIAIAALEQEQLTDEPEVNEELWREWMALFIEGIPVDSIPKPQPSLKAFPLTALPPVEPHASDSPGEILDQAELLDYIKVRGQWALPDQATSDIPATVDAVPGTAGSAPPTRGASAEGSTGEAAVAEAPAPASPEMQMESSASPVLMAELTKAIEEEPAAPLSYAERLIRKIDIVEGRPINYRLGVVVACMLERAHEQPPSLDAPPMPDVPIKLVFAGKPFTGKKTVANRLAESYNLQVICLDDVVRECLALSKRPDPLSKNPLEALKVNQIVADDLCDTHAEAGNPYVRKLQEIGYQLQELLDAGESIESSLYVHMVVAKIRSLFPERIPQPSSTEDGGGPIIEEEGLDAAEGEGDAAVQEQVDPAGAASQAAITESMPDVPDSTLLQEPSEEHDATAARGGVPSSGTMDLNEAIGLDAYDGGLNADFPDFEPPEFEDAVDELQSGGWIVVGFPDTAEAFKLFESFVSGWVSPSSRPPTEAQLRMAEAALLAPPTPQEPPPFALVPGGYDLYVRFDVPNDELVRRALGRRRDPNTSLLYHLEDNKPCFKNQVIYERLERVDDSAASGGTLTQRLHDFDISQGDVEDLLKYFGPFPDVQRMAAIDASGTFDAVYDSVEEHVAMLLDRKRAQYNKMMAEQRAAEEEAAAAAAGPPEPTEEELAAEAEAKAQAEAEAAAAAEAAAKEEAAKEAEKPKEKEKDKKGGKDKKGADKKEAEEKAATPEPVIPEEPPVPVTLEDLPAIVKKIEGPVFDLLLGQWRDLHQNFLMKAGVLFRWHRAYLEDFRLGIHNMQQYFLQFLQRPDDKQDLVDAFVNSFNAFSDEYPDMRKQDTTKDELHQKADDLHEKLQEKVKLNKGQNMGELEFLSQSQWVESQMEVLASQVQHAVALEVRRYHGACQLLTDFYYAALGQGLPAPKEANLCIDMLGKDENGAMTHKVRELKVSEDPEVPPETTFPFLEALMTSAQEAIWPMTEFGAPVEVKKEVPEANPKAKGRGSPPPENKKKGKDKEPEAPPPPPKPADPLFVDLQQALLAERLHYSHRLSAVQAWARKRLQRASEVCEAAFLQLKDCVFLRQQKELDAVGGLIDIIKEHIEDEAWIVTTLKLEGAHLHKHPNLLMKPPIIPPLPPVIENEAPHRWSMAQLDNLLTCVIGLGGMSGASVVPRQWLYSAMLRMSRAEQSSTVVKELPSVPQVWQACSPEQLQTLCGMFDRLPHSGMVDCVEFLLHISLLHSPLGWPSLERLLDVKTFLQQQAPEGAAWPDIWIEEETFLQLPLFLDPEGAEAAMAEKFSPQPPAVAAEREPLDRASAQLQWLCRLMQAFPGPDRAKQAWELETAWYEGQHRGELEKERCEKMLDDTPPARPETPVDQIAALGVAGIAGLDSPPLGGGTTFQSEHEDEATVVPTPRKMRRPMTPTPREAPTAGAISVRQLLGYLCAGGTPEDGMQRALAVLGPSDSAETAVPVADFHATLLQLGVRETPPSVEGDARPAYPSLHDFAFSIGADDQENTLIRPVEILQDKQVQKLLTQLGGMHAQAPVEKLFPAPA
mmetsp:Transcript_28813/g.67053  ORF Transcript_28813/g.67053 Transcript_28813/m.67053 type:complete len:2032 (-) Transcript_28813:99-6194(-)